MARAITVGNGNMLVCMDSFGMVRDLYYPFVGETNHVSGASGNYVHRIGVSVNGSFSWLSDDVWSVQATHEPDTAVGTITAVHKEYDIRIVSRDAVHNEHNVLLRQFEVFNTGEKEQKVKLFFAQQFRIYESRRGDTGFYDPESGGIIHYKADVVLLASAMTGGELCTEYNVGLFGIENKEGTWRDAEDGVLEGNSIEHGSVDSVLAAGVVVKPQSSKTVEYALCCAASISAARTLYAHVRNEGVEQMIDSAAAYWDAWLYKNDRSLPGLPEHIARVYKRSLLVMRLHADNRGGIIASGDTSMLHHGRDTYSYVWPRDAAMIGCAFDQAGYRDVTRCLFDFMQKCQEPEGYFLHKYRTDGLLGSSWHAWVRADGSKQLPIQQDETASLLHSLWLYYERFADLEYIESLYDSFIEPAAEWMVSYVDPETGLPLPSFDLWEEKCGTSTYTAASVYAGLMAAARFANLLGKEAASRSYEAVAARIKQAIPDFLYDEESGSFVKHITNESEGGLQYDRTVDISSLQGLLFFGVCDVHDERVQSMKKVVEERLSVSGGYVRYEGDTYYTQHDAGSPNPWVICTLWMARLYIAEAGSTDDLKKPLRLIDWVCEHAGDSDLLAEQLQVRTQEHLSASPLVWSHAELVMTVHSYQTRVEELQLAN